MNEAIVVTGMGPMMIPVMEFVIALALLTGARELARFTRLAIRGSLTRSAYPKRVNGTRE
jgi:sorbitol-specific phosphotransferase system component IIC